MDQPSDNVENGSVQMSSKPQKTKVPTFFKSYKKRLLKRDSKKFVKYVRSTSTHGVKYIFLGKSWIRRLFWSLLFLTAFSFCLYNVVTNIKSFVHAPTSTTVSSVHVSSAQFPSVTVCNMNSFRSSYLQEHQLKDIVRATIDLKLTSRTTFKQEFKDQCRDFKDPSSDIPIETVLRDGGQQLEELVLQCTFAGVPCNISEQFMPHMTPTGQCFTFNGKREDGNYSRVFGSGYRHDLELLLNVQQHEFASAVGQEAGAIITIHHPEEPPTPLTSGRVIPIGQSAYMAINQRQITDRSNTANSDCYRADQGDHLTLISDGYNYSLPACVINCTLSDIARVCNCIAAGVPKPTSGPYGSLQRCNITQLCCIAASLTISQNCGCTLPCDHTQYDVTTTYSTFPSVSEVEVLANDFNTTAEIVQHSFIKLHVYFAELIVVKEITDRSYTLTALIADIGGAMGLFLGASIISLTEFLMWVFDELKDRCCGINEKKLKKDLKERRVNNKEKHPKINNKDLMISFTSDSSNL